MSLEKRFRSIEPARGHEDGAQDPGGRGLLPPVSGPPRKVHGFLEALSSGVVLRGPGEMGAKGPPRTGRDDRVPALVRRPERLLEDRPLLLPAAEDLEPPRLPEEHVEPPLRREQRLRRQRLVREREGGVAAMFKVTTKVARGKAKADTTRPFAAGKTERKKT